MSAESKQILWSGACVLIGVITNAMTRMWTSSRIDIEMFTERIAVCRPCDAASLISFYLWWEYQSYDSNNATLRRRLFACQRKLIEFFKAQFIFSFIRLLGEKRFLIELFRTHMVFYQKNKNKNTKNKKKNRKNRLEKHTNSKSIYFDFKSIWMVNHSKKVDFLMSRNSTNHFESHVEKFHAKSFFFGLSMSRKVVNRNFSEFIKRLIEFPFYWDVCINKFRNPDCRWFTASLKSVC